MPRILLLIVSVFFVLLTACQKEAVYSCDPSVDKWAKDNLNHIQQMMRADFIKINDIPHQKAAFRAFLPEQRKAIWIIKLTEVLTLNWSENERRHIESLLVILNKYDGIFSNNLTEQQHDQYLIDAYRWAEYATESLGWDKAVIRAIAGNPNKMLTKAGMLAQNSQGRRIVKTRSESGGKADCECNLSSSPDDSLIFYDCGSSGGCYAYLNCNVSSFGCNLFWGDPCDGLCS